MGDHEDGDASPKLQLQIDRSARQLTAIERTAGIAIGLRPQIGVLDIEAMAVVVSVLLVQDPEFIVGEAFSQAFDPTDGYQISQGLHTPV